MKFSRILAATAGVALVGASTLLTAGAANAADLYPVSPFPAETSPYPAGWFQGNTAPGGNAVSGVAGLAITGPYQLLNGTTPTDSLVDLVNDAALVSTGSANFQIPLFNDGANSTGFATIRSDNYGPASMNTLAGWRSSGTVGDISFGGIVANESHTLVEFQAALDASPTDYELLAFGVNVPAGETAVVSSITWAGDTHHFTPTPVTTGAATITLAAIQSTGYTATASGFVPGETVDVGYGTGGSGGGLGTVTADANGVATYTLVDSDDTFGVSPGYTLSFTTAATSVFIPFEVVANPAAGPAATLPVTGADITSGSIAAGLLLLIGAAFGIIAVRRRSARA